MNIAVIGSGGREHAICEKICFSKKVTNIFCIPGNPGTANLGINLDINFLNFDILYKNLKKYKIKLVIVGPELPLVRGLVNFLAKRKIKVFGPNKFASKLEGSKSFMKKICKENNIPTANYKVCKNKKQVIQFLKNNKLPIVVKADGLASGKGVMICKKKEQVLTFSEKIFSGEFKTSKKLILEQFLKGEEVSYFIVADKNNFSFIGSAQDHKRVGLGDKGLNTGGMGAYSPAPIIDKILENKIQNKIIKPTLAALKKSGNNYTGFLYAGLMIVNKNPFLIEYNVRMGDPECQVILPRIKTDFFDIINHAVNNKLKKIKINWLKFKSMTIVLCSKGYPKKYIKGNLIKDLGKIKLGKNNKIYHAGTKKIDNKLYSIGGRVLNITSTGKSFKSIRKKIINLIKKVEFKNSFYRKDIGWRVIK